MQNTAKRRYFYGTKVLTALKHCVLWKALHKFDLIKSVFFFFKLILFYIPASFLVWWGVCSGHSSYGTVHKHYRGSGLSHLDATEEWQWHHNLHIHEPLSNSKVIIMQNHSRFYLPQSLLEEMYLPGGESLILLRSLGEYDEGLIQGPALE